MKALSVDRAPRLSRTRVSPREPSAIAATAAPAFADDSNLRRASVVARLVVLALCVARVRADLMQGPLTPEGGLALALFVVFALSLVVKPFR
jgi:hypothetical protein